VVFDFLRDGKPQRGTVTLKGAWPFRMFARHYDERPQYVMFAGLLFQPLTRDLMEAYGVADLEVSYHYGQFVTDELYQQRREIVVFSNLLPDEVNSSLRHFVMSVVDKVNGKPVGSLAELAKLLDEPAELYVIDLVGRGRPIVLEAALVREAQARIQERYDVRQERYLGHD
jgi:hypothetical protein